jgi:hypothetical protein
VRTPEYGVEDGLNVPSFTCWLPVRMPECGVGKIPSFTGCRLVRTPECGNDLKVPSFTSGFALRDTEDTDALQERPAHLTTTDG